MEVLWSTGWGIATLSVVCVAVWMILSISLYRPFFKRFYDILLSSIAIAVFSPLLIILTIAGAVKMHGNPFFTQVRPGKKEKLFRLIKFRTMTNKKDKHGVLLPDEQRVTRYGEILRATSLDELPELFNIFVGQMSIVGPRPVLVHYLPYYSEEQNLRHSVRPGLTGLAQVSGRNGISWKEKLAYDLSYVRHVGLFGDVKIILRTVMKVLRKTDVTVGKEQELNEEFYPNRAAKPKNEIGGVFCLSTDNVVQTEPVVRTDRCYTAYFRSGRHALRAVLAKVRLKKCFLPVFSSENVFELFFQDGRDVSFYGIQDDFSIDGQDLIKQIKTHGLDCVVYLQSYFGSYRLSEIKRKLKHIKGVTVIEDITHSLLNRQSFKNSNYYIASLRQWAGIAEGGLCSSCDVSLKAEQEGEEERYRAFEKINVLMLDYRSSPNAEKKKECQELLKAFSDELNGDTVFGMNAFSLDKFRTLDFASIRASRRANYDTLYLALNENLNGVIVPLGRLNETVTPLYFPVFCENRDELQARLVAEDVYAPIIWTRSNYTSDVSCGIYDKILCLPVDQRYTKSDMLRIVDVIEHESTPKA